jgi:hypothetical protein
MAHDNELILIGFAEALSAPEVAWCLLDAGFRVVAFTKGRHKSPLRRCKSIDLIKVTAPEDDAFRTVSELQSIYKSLRAAAIMPLNDGALWLCSKLASKSEVVVAGPTGEQAQFALDKRVQLKAAQEAGFNVPRTFFLESIEDAAKITNFPIVLRPALNISERGGRLSKGSLYFCANRHELDKAIKTWDGKQPLLVQSVLKGVGEGLFGLATHTGIHVWSAHQRIRMMNPKGSGSSACKAVSITDQPANIAEQMLLKAKWRGMFMIELLRDESDKIWFIEFNGRSWGSMALALRMGFKYPAWTIMQTFDSSFYPEPPAACEFISCRHLGRELIHLLHVLRGPSSTAIPGWPSIWRTFSAVLRISKRDRWYNCKSGYKALFLEDTYDTILNETLRKWLK